jgi:hypothetical protein
MNASGQTTVGTAQVMPALNNASPVGVAIFSYHNKGITISEAGTPTMGLGSAFRMYAEADKTNLIVTAIAIENAWPSDTTVNFDLTGLDGTSSGLSGQLVVPAGGQRALFLNQIPGFENLPLPFKGVLRVSTANQNITVLGAAAAGMNAVTSFSPRLRRPMKTQRQVRSSCSRISLTAGIPTQFIMFSGTPSQPAYGGLQMFSQSGGSLNVNLQ